MGSGEGWGRKEGGVGEFEMITMVPELDADGENPASSLTVKRILEYDFFFFFGGGTVSSGEG